MKKIKSPMLCQLLQDLRFSPQKQKLNQLVAAEKLYYIIQPQIEYSYEFVCCLITGYRPKQNSSMLIKGEDLIQDLYVFILSISSELALNTNDINEKLYTIGEVAQQFDVSIRTVERWKNRGLLSGRYTFPDGKKRNAFRQKHLDRFVQDHPELVKKAEGFSKVDQPEKDKIVQQARLLAEQQHFSRQAAIIEISRQTCRSRDTVRRILIEYEKDPAGTPIFSRPAGVISSRQEKEIYRLLKAKTPIEELMQKFYRSKSSIYRIINKRRIRELKKAKIDYMSNDEFMADDAEVKILASPLNGLADLYDHPHETEFTSDTLPVYLNNVSSIKPLTREVEADLFKRYNYLKFRASIEIAKFNNMPRVNTHQIAIVEKYIEQAEQIRKIIIVSNLRLVISIANRHAGWGTQLSDLISEGNLSLMRAVEKFDYSRGFRFSTYASWAISKDFARRIPAEASRPDKPTSMDIDEIQTDFRDKNRTGVNAVEQAHNSLEHVIVNNLTEREQYIINNHYGLIKMGMKKKYKSLNQIGDEIGLSKERVRQLELVALQKLRQSLGPEEFELLTK